MITAASTSTSPDPFALLDLSPQPSLAAFDHLSKGAPAPYWLFKGVAAAWCLDPERMDLTLITVSENATFLLSLDGQPAGAIRVSQPGYVGGPAAVVSEIAWVTALRSALPEVDALQPVPSPRGPYVAQIKDQSGTGWVCVSTRFVAGEPLEDLEDPSSYYRTIGRWVAQFHEHARSWELPHSFKRFTWDLDDMVGPSCRWGRWEGASGLTDAELGVLARAQDRALGMLDNYRKTPQTWGLIHADLRPSNILTDGTKLTVIDFDDCGFGYFLYDYAASLSFVEHEPYARAMANSWMAGYQEISPLSTQDVLHASALSMIRRLQMLGWTVSHREDALPPHLYAGQRPGTVEVAQKFLASPTWLLE